MSFAEGTLFSMIFTIVDNLGLLEITPVNFSYTDIIIFVIRQL